MKCNILVDYIENGIDRNRPHIVLGTTNEIVAGMAVKKEYEENGCIVQAMTVIDGDYTLDQLHAMANYGDGIDKVNYRIIYVSEKTMEYFKKMQQDPEASRKLREEIERRRLKNRYRTMD